MNNVESEYPYNVIYSHEYEQNNTDINNEDPAFLFIGASTLFCFYFCSILFDIIIKKYKNYKIEKNLLLPINIEDIKENECSICLEEYNRDKDIIKLNCNHEYHRKCIKEWLKINKNCPQCRKNII